jgi:UDP-N-acetylglucosamine--N-acetylmuramyl-(pentapeptide) pyrophosphoryl-undecaprenol N-acetylglucosamine transferase
VDDHQSANARYLSEGGAALQVAQTEFNAGWLSGILRTLGRAQLREMACKARTLGRAEATQAVARVCIEVAR